jgi:hypothetical protein
MYWVTSSPRTTSAYVADCFARSASHSDKRLMDSRVTCSAVAQTGNPALTMLSSQSFRSAAADGAHSPVSEMPTLQLLRPTKLRIACRGEERGPAARLRCTLNRRS